MVWSLIPIPSIRTSFHLILIFNQNQVKTTLTKNKEEDYEKIFKFISDYGIYIWIVLLRG